RDRPAPSCAGYAGPSLVCDPVQTVERADRSAGGRGTPGEPVLRRALASTPFQHPGPLELPVPLLLRRPLVMLLLAAGQTDRELRSAVAPVELERHERVAAALDEPRQPVDLIAMKQKPARTGRVGLDVRRRRQQRRDVRAEQPGLVVAEHDVRLGELRLAGAQALHLPSLELEAGFEILLDEEIEARLTVLRDGAL